MPEFHIPERIKSVVARILRLGDNDYEQILAALESVQPALNVERLIADVSSLLPGTDTGVEEIVRALDSMTHVRLRADRTVEQFLRDITSSFESQFESPQDRKKVLDRVSAFLSTKALLVSARAYDLQHDFDRIFVSAKIVSDVRTVFDQGGKEIQGSIIVHNLNITYAQDGDFKDFYLAMDSADIAKLRAVLDRSDAKTGALKGLIGSAGSAYFESGD